MSKFHHQLRFLFVGLLALLITIQPTPTSAKIDTADLASVTDNRWVISEFYPGSDDDYTGAYIEIYNNTDKRTIGYKDFVINLPFNLELPPVYDIHNYKAHAYKKLALDEGWSGYVVKLYLRTMYGDDKFQEVEDALNETDGYSYQRCQLDANHPEISEQFFYGKKSPGKHILCSDKSVTPAPSDILGESDAADNQCAGLRLNEIYANTDDDQFIEIKNTADHDINLAKCYWSNNKDADTSGEIELFSLADGEANLEPGAFTVIHPVDTSLGKINKTRGVIYLVDTDKESTVDYKRYITSKAGLALALDDQSTWQSTAKPTPGETNVIAAEPCSTGKVRDSTTGKCVKDSGKAKAKTCPEGQYLAKNNRCYDEKEESDEATCDNGYVYDEASGQCVEDDSGANEDTILTAAKTCATGYTLNPSTNRCIKNKTSTSSTKSTGKKTTSSALTPCKDGYERNPATNRCVKKKTTTNTTKTPCKEGYERNPETGRCRKKTSTSNSTSATGATDSAKFPITTKNGSGGTGTTSSRGLIVALGAISGVSAIILIWQYRAEIGRLLGRLTHRASGK